MRSRAATQRPLHHFFGFHDVTAWNPAGDKMAALRVATIDRPPIAGDVAEAGFVGESGTFVPVAETTAFNFPQGARQLWGPSDAFWLNQRRDDGWRASLYDASGRLLLVAERALYALAPDGMTGYGLEFSRLNRLGGYGYVGFPDPNGDQARPELDGVWEVDLASGKSNLLVSISDVAAPVETPSGTHHYLTHIVPSPSGGRILFLHRWWLADGGIGSRLVSARSDGTDLRCHAEGFLSHFDWMDDRRIVIWGRPPTSTDRLRRIPGIQLAGPLLKAAKGFIRAVRPAAKGADGMSFMMLDVDEGPTGSLWPEVLTEDGHPMFCPANRDWMSVDTYPNEDRMRQLKLIRVSTGETVELGTYQFADLPLDARLLSRAFEHLDPVVLKNVDRLSFGFARSGLHCDLHPRWKVDGTALAFDSTHEGSRQVYVVDTSAFVDSA